MTATSELVEPGRGAGLLDVARHRFLLKLIVRQELRVRYRGSVLGLFWTYVKPGLQFGVYFFALGVFLQLNDRLEDFAIYLLSGLVIVNFFGEALYNAVRAIVRNAPLVKKIYMPRELFPVASMWVAAVHLLPQVVVLFIGALVSGWRPSVAAIFSGLLGFAIVAVLASGMGLLLSALNAYFRDVENFVDLLLIVLVWCSPILYPWSFARAAIGPAWLEQLYLANPLTVAAQLWQRAFWLPGVDPSLDELIPDLFARGLIALVGGLVVLGLGQLAFSRLEGNFAQEL